MPHLHPLLKTLALTLVLVPAALFAQQPASSHTQPAPQIQSPLDQVNSLERSLSRIDKEKSPLDWAQNQIQLAGWLLCLSPHTHPQALNKSIIASQKALETLNPVSQQDLRIRAQIMLTSAMMISSDLDQASPDKSRAAAFATMDRHLMAADPSAAPEPWSSDKYAVHPQFKQNILKAISIAQAAFVTPQSNPPTVSRPQILACIAYLWSVLPAQNPQEQAQYLQNAQVYWSTAIALLPANTPVNVKARYQCWFANSWWIMPAQNDLEKRTNLTFSASLCEQILNTLANENQPQATYDATNCLALSLINMPPAATQERLLLSQRGAAACESALRTVPADFNPTSRGHIHLALSTALLQIALFPGQTNALLCEQGIAHRKAGIALITESKPELAQIMTVHLAQFKKDYESIITDKNTPFDSIKPAQ